MGLTEQILIAVGLSMDAFAVSIGKGLCMKSVSKKNVIKIALCFGVFQALMPLIGYILGSSFAKYIMEIDHWIIFILLAFIGGNMIKESFSEEEEDKLCKEIDFRELIFLGIATSIDALAVGITFALMPTISIGFAIILIGIVTFLISYGGVYLGNRFGRQYELGAQILGGFILIFIGIKILLKHLGIF